MLTSPTGPAPDAPRLLLAGFGPYPQAPHNPAGRVVEQLTADGWTPPGVRLHALVLPVSWTGAPAAAIEAVRWSEADAVLLLAATTNAPELRIEMRAQNRAARRRPDAFGELWGDNRIDPTGLGVMRTTAPVAEMVQAVKALGLDVRASSESGDYVGNLVLYRLLAEFGAEGRPRPVGCLSIPARMDLQPALDATKAAVETFAESLSVGRPALISA